MNKSGNYYSLNVVIRYNLKGVSIYGSFVHGTSRFGPRSYPNSNESPKTV